MAQLGHVWTQVGFNGLTCLAVEVGPKTSPIRGTQRSELSLKPKIVGHSGKKRAFSACRIESAKLARAGPGCPQISGSQVGGHVELKLGPKPEPKPCDAHGSRSCSTGLNLGPFGDSFAKLGPTWGTHGSTQKSVGNASERACFEDFGLGRQCPLC
jgi:hypothetical protein